MSTPEINIRDSNFGHHPKSLTHEKEATYMRWCRENRPVSKSCFITDLHLHEIFKCNAKRKIGWLIEPRAINPMIYDFADKHYKEFDYILTFDKELLDSGRNFLFYPFSCCWIKDTNVPEKSKMCSMVASDKTQTSGHQFRQQVISKLKDKVDHFGRGFKFVELKEEALQDYYFSIVIENSQSDFYFSEKLIDCFATRTIPIYWGCDSIGKFFNVDGMIRFNTMDELEDIVNNLTIDQYKNMIKAAEENWQIVIDNEYEMPEDWLFKQYPFLFD